MTKDANQAGDHPKHFLKEWREFMGWSQELLADKVDAHQSKIQRVESGKRELKMGFLQDLARAFNVPASAVLEINPATPSGAQTASMLLAWNELTETQRADVLKMVRALAAPNDQPKAG
ncbi:MAG: hypothetical protein BroJett013_06940 [Alphaproteobacteria bacterium]|nr:MAG: hypothetical protein BroJett013_06940 [Alphaproteobacteria bacterium]